MKRSQEEISQDEETSKTDKKIIILLDLACLETTKTRRGDFELLNCDDHQRIAKKHGKNPSDYRPDILHQELLAILDSPLNKAGHIQVFVHSREDVLIEINPKTRIPRTFKRFSGLMVQLLHKFKIRASNNSEILLKVVKNPVTRHLPPGFRAFGFSQAGKLYSPDCFARKLPDDVPVVLVVGAMASGSIKIEDHPYCEEMISISEYPLSGACAIARILGGIESHRGIV